MPHLSLKAAARAGGAGPGLRRGSWVVGRGSWLTLSLSQSQSQSQTLTLTLETESATGAPGPRGCPEAQMRHHVLTEVLFELLNSFAQITDLLDHISGAQQYPVNFNDSLVKTEH